LDHLGSFYFLSVGRFSQHTAITPLDFLYLGSFRKKLFSHRDFSYSKRSFSYEKTMFSSFDRVHHLASFCTFAVAPAQLVFPSVFFPSSFSSWLPLCFPTAF